MYTANKQQQSDVYTLQSIKTGKYISSLFSDSHNETFKGRSTDDAYTWNTLEAVTKVKEKINYSLIIKVSK